MTNLELIGSPCITRITESGIGFYQGDNNSVIGDFDLRRDQVVLPDTRATALSQAFLEAIKKERHSLQQIVMLAQEQNMIAFTVFGTLVYMPRYMALVSLGHSQRHDLHSFRQD